MIGDRWPIIDRELSELCTCSSVQRAQLETDARTFVASCAVHSA